MNQPSWSMLIPDGDDGSDNTLWRLHATAEWHRVTTALTDAGILAEENRHQLQRLILAYIGYDRAVTEVWKLGGPVTISKNGMEMLRQWDVVMRNCDAAATKAEVELGIPPRRRGDVTKAIQRKAAVTKANLYLLDTTKRKSNG